MKTCSTFLAFSLAACGMVTTVSAHHSVAEIYDIDKVVPLSGVVTSVQVVNPHVTVNLDTRDALGNVTTWTIEVAPPNALRRRRFDPRSLTPGQQVTFESGLRKDGRREATGRTLVTGDGKRVDVGDGLGWSMVAPSK